MSSNLFTIFKWFAIGVAIAFSFTLGILMLVFLIEYALGYVF